MAKKILNIPEHATVSLTPGNPDSGNMKIYPKNDNEWYTLDSSGNESRLAKFAKYANVVFVDQANGNNSTGTINEPNKPFLTVSAARSAALLLPGLSSQNKALVYIRRGEYSTVTMTLADNLDFYCEPGVVFVGTTQIRDLGVAVTSNVYGYLQIRSTGTTIPVVFTGASSIVFEFDQIFANSAALEVNTASSNNKITIKGNYIYSGTFGQGFGITIRQAANVVMNVVNSIEAIHSVLAFRFYTGTTVINCPTVNLLAGNIYGGNFKHGIITYDASSVGSITLNGNLNNKDAIDYAGSSSMIVQWAGGQPKLTVNGNIYGGLIKALDGNTNTVGSIEINGNMSSSKDYTVWAYGSGQVVIKNSTIINTNAAVGASYVVAINGTAKVFFKGCYIYGNKSDSDIIAINGASTNLVLDDCAVYSSGALGASILSTAGAVTVRAHNCRFNKAVTVDITDLYVPTGITVDANLIVPTSIN
jgi:hypothetical protein